MTHSLFMFRTTEADKGIQAHSYQPISSIAFKIAVVKYPKQSHYYYKHRCKNLIEIVQQRSFAIRAYKNRHVMHFLAPTIDPINSRE
jgi:hypothetical protein